MLLQFYKCQFASIHPASESLLIILLVFIACIMRLALREVGIWRPCDALFLLSDTMRRWGGSSQWLKTVTPKDLGLTELFLGMHWLAKNPSRKSVGETWKADFGLLKYGSPKGGCQTNTAIVPGQLLVVPPHSMCQDAWPLEKHE